MSEEDYEMMVKIILIGDSAVGKTNIMSKYLKGEFQENTKATVGVEFGSKLFKIDNHTIKAQIWDTAGQEKYKAITGAYYKGSKGAFVVYDITRRDTFESADRWINDLKITADPKINIILIGNKSDLEDKREVSKESVQKLIKDLDIDLYYETSAKNSTNVNEAFITMTKEVMKNTSKKGPAPKKDNVVVTTAPSGQSIQSGKGCC